MAHTPHITLVGCGKMGSALLSGWLKQMPDLSVSIIEPYGLPDVFKDYPSIRHFENIVDYIEAKPAADMLVLAIKPQVLDQACREIAPAIASGTLVISIAAGKTIGNVARFFHASQPVVRAMPNTPAAIGKGITVAVANEYVSDKQRQSANDALEAGGDVAWINEESLMDAVTAISGSGPAYFYRFTESLAQAGIALGLDENLAKTLARKTFEGSAALSVSTPEIAIATLRENVTSPGGTTEAALNDMNKEGGLDKVVESATQAAQKRGQELSTG